MLVVHSRCDLMKYDLYSELFVEKIICFYVRKEMVARCKVVDSTL